MPTRFSLELEGETNEGWDPKIDMAPCSNHKGLRAREGRRPAQCLLTCFILSLATLAVFGQVLHHDFINYDDPDYVTTNPHVRAGLTIAGVAWACTSSYASNWHPLTWFSHMLDCQLFGLNAGHHHFMSVLIHLANGLLLFAVMRRMTGAIAQSAVVAFLFALHPLHVESVAWAAERKDVLSTFFWMLTTLAYVRYVERPAFRRYLLALTLFGMGLMSKPMVVTLPFVLLLLDFWPLRRLHNEGPRNTKVRSFFGEVNLWFSLVRLGREKLPFFALSAASIMVTFLVQRRWGAVVSAEVIPIKGRIENLFISYVFYIRKTLWPYDLAVFYPSRQGWPLWGVLLSAALLAGVTAAVVWRSRRYPYLTVGWLWFLGTLVPVIGLVQVGAQSMADRYTYIPLIGIFIIVTWHIPSLIRAERRRSLLLGMSAAVLLLACAVSTWRQLRYWENSSTLFERALSVTSNNCVAHGGLGVALADAGKLDEAIGHFTEALRINPNYSMAHANLGLALARKGNVGEAIAHYRQTLRLKPEAIETLNNLAWILATTQDQRYRDGREALAIARRACELAGNSNAEVLDTMAAAYAESGRFEDAVQMLQRAINLAAALKDEGAVRGFQTRMRLYQAGQPFRE
jgi:tetratricopeptide (TPR) repeat protein